MIIDQNILLQVQALKISTEKAKEMLEEDLKIHYIDRINHQIDNTLDSLRQSGTGKKEAINLLKLIKNLINDENE